VVLPLVLVAILLVCNEAMQLLIHLLKALANIFSDGWETLNAYGKMLLDSLEKELLDSLIK